MAEGQITFTTEEGEEVIFFVVEETTIAGVNYLLVADSEEDEADAYIMKELQDDEGEITYEILEDERDINAISKVFAELLEDVTFDS